MAWKKGKWILNKARLSDGRVVEYSAASDSIDAYEDVEDKIYLGTGVCIEIAGENVESTENEVRHFWLWRED